MRRVDPTIRMEGDIVKRRVEGTTRGGKEGSKIWDSASIKDSEEGVRGRNEKVWGVSVHGDPYTAQIIHWPKGLRPEI